MKPTGRSLRSDHHPDPVAKFEKIERIELMVAELFHLLAARFADHPDLAEVFVRLERQEIQHALRARMACRDFLADHGTRDEPAVHEDALDALIIQGEEALERFGGERPKIGFDEALAAMLRLERDLAGAHSQFSQQEADPALRSFFAMLTEQDVALQRTLQAKRDAFAAAGG